MEMSFTPQEIIERNQLQKDDSKRYRDWACRFLDKPDISDSELFLWYVDMGFAQMFAIAWREGQDPLNLYYTGLEVCHPPNKAEGYWHFFWYLASLEQKSA